MKKLLFIFMLVLSLTLAACNAEPTKKEETEEENTQLATPKVSIDEDGLATWSKIKNADGYAYKINDGKVKYTDECEVQLELGDSIVVKAISDEDDYEDSEYSKTKTYEDESNKNKLDTPKLSIDEYGCVRWKKVKNADAYAYKINDGQVKYTENCYVYLSLGDSIIVKAITDSSDYEDSDYSDVLYCEYVEQEVTQWPTQIVEQYKLGMGIVVELPKYAFDSDYINSTVAAVVLDEDGVIVACRIDMMRNNINLGSDGQVSVPELYETRMELGERDMLHIYGASMDWNNDGRVLPWYQQVQAFEAYVVGKTAEEVMNMPTQTVEGSGYIISDAPELLSAGCTLQIVTFKEAVYKACVDEQGMTFETSDNFTLGVAINSYNDQIINATSVNSGKAYVFSDFAASVVADGKILASLNDATQPRIDFDYYGNRDSRFAGTKRELKEAYNMTKYGSDWNGDGKVLEWYLQSQAFSFHVVGMTGEEVANMPTQTLSSGYVVSSEEALLASGCTIQITGIKAIVSESVYNAR